MITMNLDRRTFVVSASALFATSRLTARSQETDVTSGGIGLSYDQILSLYEELPVGQSYRNFAEPETGAQLFINFGENDFAETIWVSGEIEQEAMNSLITWLCPSDAVIEHWFAMSDSAGSIAYFNVEIMSSKFLEEQGDGRTRLMAKYVTAPGSPETGTNLIISVELANQG